MQLVKFRIILDFDESEIPLKYQLAILVLTSLSFFLSGCSDAVPTKTQKEEAAGDIPAIDLPEKTIDSLFKVEKGYAVLSLEDFEEFQEKSKQPVEEPTWSEKSGIISCTGNPRGYLYSKKNHGNFSLRLEYRFPESSEKNENTNTGILIYITGENKIWPRCLEVQGKFEEMAQIKSNTREVTLEVTDNQKARETARRPIGEWNSIEVISKDGEVTSILNGTRIASCKPSELTEGFFGIQSEGDVVEFRNIRVQRLTD